VFQTSQHRYVQANTTLLRSLQGLPPKSGQRGKDNLMELIGQGPVKFSDAAEQHHGPHSASSSRSASPPVRGPGAHKLERSSSAPIQSNESQHHHLEGRAESVHGVLEKLGTGIQQTFSGLVDCILESTNMISRCSAPQPSTPPTMAKDLPKIHPRVL